MNDKINQDTINKALWAACDTFRGTISADIGVASKASVRFNASEPFSCRNSRSS
ncbi:hypothetical protein LAW89_22350 [Escherichia coli]|nr:hypothetical protein [Escherichia coli]